MQKKPLRSWTIALAFLVLLILSFGLMIPWLGLYWDDWPIVLVTRLQGVNTFWDFYRYERPFSAWTYIVTAPILGTRPVIWHLFTLLLRWVTVIGMWWSLQGLWPRRKREVTWIALVFAIYPVFTQQSVSIAFSQHWICYALYFLSLGAMIQSVRTPRWFWLLNLAGVVATLVNMLTLEYFWGLELLRPIILWLIYGERQPEGGKRLQATLKLWVPYLVVLIIVVTWRMASMETLHDANEPDLLYELSASPLTTLLQFLQNGLQDVINNFIGAWYNTIDPTDIELTSRPMIFSLFIALLTAGLTYYYLLRLSTSESEGSSLLSDRQWVRQALLIGTLGTLLGPLPIWVINRQAIFGLYSGRFALAAMLGLSILLVGLLEWFTPRLLPKVILLAAMIGMAAGFHLRTSVSFYRSTLKQNQFYWQLYWRAPYIKPGTAILSADELFIYVGRNPTAVALNLLYPQPFGSRQVDYWFLELYHDVGPKMVPKLVRGKTFNPSFRTFEFTGSSLDSLVIFYKPGAGRCLWVLSPEDADNPELPELTRVASPVSNLSRIEATPLSTDYPPVDLFGKEPEHTWCYYFQKAELALQMGDWQKVAQLGDQAQKQGYSPGNSHEWLPFIEGYAKSSQWEDALEGTIAAFAMNEEIAPRLCRGWEHILGTATPPTEIDEKVIHMRNQLGC